MPGTIDRLLAIRRMLFIGLVRPAMRSSDAPCLYQHQALIRQTYFTPRSCMTSNVPPWDPKLPPCRDTFSSRLFTFPVYAGINTWTISHCSLTFCRPETPCATIPCSQYTVPSSQSVATVHLRLDSRLAQRQLRVPMRSKQGALGLLRRADYPGPACMPSVAVSGRCVTVISAR